MFLSYSLLKECSRGIKVFPKVLIVSIFKDTWKQPEKSAAASEKEREEELQQTGNGVAGAKRRYPRESSSTRL